MYKVTVIQPETFITLELSQQSKSGSTLPSSEQVEVSSHCRLENMLCLCLPVCPAHAVLERCPKSLSIDFSVKTFNCFLKQPWGVIARWQAGARTWPQAWTLLPDQRVVKGALKLQNKLCGVFVLRSVENAKIEDSSELIPTVTTLTHQSVFCMDWSINLVFVNSCVGIHWHCKIYDCMYEELRSSTTQWISDTCQSAVDSEALVCASPSNPSWGMRVGNHSTLASISASSTDPKIFTTQFVHLLVRRHSSSLSPSSSPCRSSGNYSRTWKLFQKTVKGFDGTIDAWFQWQSRWGTRAVLHCSCTACTS